jgi:hypothetical protein
VLRHRPNANTTRSVARKEDFSATKRIEIKRDAPDQKLWLVTRLWSPALEVTGSRAFLAEVEFGYRN